MAKSSDSAQQSARDDKLSSGPEAGPVHPEDIDCCIESKIGCVFVVNFLLPLAVYQIEVNRCSDQWALRGFGLIAVLLLGAWQTFGQSPFEGATAPGPRTQLDEFVFARLQALNITPARPCSDAAFVRRAYLDLTGTLPSGFEAQQFIVDPDPNKRQALIDRLLASDEFADYLAMKWGDLLRIKAEFPINLWPNAAQAYHRWVRQAIRDNKPYDQFARQLLTSSGSNFETPPVNFYRAMQSRTPGGIAQTVALTFLGERAEHWPSNQWANLSVFFANLGYKSTAEWKEEIVFFNPASTNKDALKGSARSATLPDGITVTLLPNQDPRRVFTDWLVKQPQFSRSLVNRAWSWLLGRGIIHEPDDIRPDNPPSNSELLAFLEKEFISSGYNFKRLYRLILVSQVYQLSAIPRSQDPQAAMNFAFYAPRRLEAEVLIDAVDQITGTHENYSSAIPEPYTFIPDSVKSVALPDGSITSSFLEMFGRPPRDTGLESERNNRMSVSQKLFFLNSRQIQGKLESCRMITFQSSPERTPAESVRGIYLGVLSRFPTPDEMKTAQAYLQSGLPKRQATIDLAWALLNTSEFLYRH